MQWRFIITLWNSLPVCFDTYSHRSHALSHSVDLCWGCSWAELRLELGSGPRNPPPLPLCPEKTPRECLLSERTGQKKESGGGGGGKKGGKSRKGWRQESIGRITQPQWNIPNYVSAWQIPPCGHIVMRERYIGGNERASLCLAEYLRPSCSPLSVLRRFVYFGTNIVI